MLHIMYIYIHTYYISAAECPIWWQTAVLRSKRHNWDLSGKLPIQRQTSRFSGKLLDSAANFRAQRQTSGLSGKLPDSAANFRIQRQTSRFSGKLPIQRQTSKSAANFQISGKLPISAKSYHSTANRATLFLQRCIIGSGTKGCWRASLSGF